MASTCQLYDVKLFSGSLSKHPGSMTPLVQKRLGHVVTVSLALAEEKEKC